MQLLLTDILDWLSFILDNYSNDSPIWCLLEIHLDYPNELHDMHNDYTLVDENIEVRKSMLSSYKSQIIDNNLLLVKRKSILPNFDKKRKSNSTIKT